MALIQIRDVPEETYETIRRRARAAGQSIQAYMRAHLIAFAGQPTPAEVIDELEADLATRPPLELTTEEILEARDADRKWS
jgi:antitoxin FitA